jgi:hypothetical protein
MKTRPKVIPRVNGWVDKKHEQLEKMLVDNINFWQKSESRRATKSDERDILDYSTRENKMHLLL